MGPYSVLCFSAAVLDRLNSALEPGGQLTLNERGLVDGKTLVIQAHPYFRFVFIRAVLTIIEVEFESWKSRFTEESYGRKVLLKL